MLLGQQSADLFRGAAAGGVRAVASRLTVLGAVLLSRWFFPFAT